MRILVLTSWWPEPADNGIRLRIGHLLRALAHEHELHLVAFSQGGLPEQQRERMQAICASAYAVPQQAAVLRRSDILASLWHNEPASVRRTWSPQYAAMVTTRAAEIQPHAILAFELSTAPYARLVPRVPRLLEDLELAQLAEQYTNELRPRQRLRAWLTWRKHQSYVRRVLPDFSVCTVVSQTEQQLARRLAPSTTTIAVIPNGAELSPRLASWGTPEPDTLIYPGALSFDANFDAMHYFLSAIYPAVQAARPAVQLRITGKADPERRAALPAATGVEYTGFVPDVRPLVARSWCEIVPLRTGSGTRLKVLEALALGTPVISTTKGIEGLELEHERHVLIADGAEAFATATVRLLEQPALRARLAAEGRRLIAEKYDWQIIGRKFATLFAELPAADTKQRGLHTEKVR